MPDCSELDPCFVVTTLSAGDLAALTAPLILLLVVNIALLVRALR